MGMICMCGAQAGYPHDDECPYPYFGGNEDLQEEWNVARIEKRRQSSPVNADNNPLLKIIPENFFGALVRSNALGKRGITAILTTKIIEQLHNNRAVLMDLEDGGTIVLLPQALVESVYEPQMTSTPEPSPTKAMGDPEKP